MNTQNQCNIKLPSLLAALRSLLEQGHHDSAAGKTDRTSSLPSDEVQASGRLDNNESPKIRRLSPDSTAGCMGLNFEHCQVKTEPADMDELATTSSSKSSRHDYHITSKCDAQALVGSVYQQLREAERQSRMVQSFPPVPPASVTGTVITDVMPECRLMVDQALLELAAEARQVPEPGSEREALVEQVIRSVVDAHLKTCRYTREAVDAGFHRYRQVSINGVIAFILVL